jgi:hypothetical protein
MKTRSPKSKPYRGRSAEELQTVLLSYEIKPDVAAQLEKEWERWRGEPATNGRTYANGFVLIPHSDKFLSLSFSRAAIDTETRKLVGKAVRTSYTVYRNEYHHLP